MTIERFFVVAGMHRSHTSLLGRMLVAAGMKFHDELVDANRSNPYGHYEDVDLLALQRAILKDNRAKWFRGTGKQFSVTPERQAEADEILRTRFEELGNNWGFKVPDSTLFLDFWSQWQGARFLLIYRQPEAVLSSLFRRMGRQFYYRPDAVMAMTDAYIDYNRRILLQKEAFPERTYIVSSDHLLADPSRVLRSAAQKLEFPLGPQWQGESMIDRKINSAPSQALERFVTAKLAARHDVREIYERLNTLADSGKTA